MGSEHKQGRLAASTLSALSAQRIIYSDIEPSPLCTSKMTFNPAHGLALSTLKLLGVIS